MKVYVNKNDKRWRKYRIAFTRIVRAALLKENANAHVSITLTDDNEIHDLNRRYRGIDKPTNVLSFELGDPILLGDIFISLDTVMREAHDAGISVAEHTAHMIVHGVLHLQGYDHIKDDEATVMENLEIEIMKKLGYKNPYADESAVCSDISCCPGSGFLNRIRRIKMRYDGLLQYIVMAILGTVASLGFAPFNLWWATALSIGVAYWITMRGENRGGFWRTFFRVAPFGAMYSVAMFWWMLNSIYVVPELMHQFAIWTIPAVVGLAIAGAVIFSVPFVAVSRARAAVAVRPFLFAAAWTFVLWMREWFLTGFPWNPIANISMTMPWLANSMSIWGALGLTFVIIGTIASIVNILMNRRCRACWGAFWVFSVLIIVGVVGGYRNVMRANVQNNMSPVIRVIQPAQSQSQKMIRTREDAISAAQENVKRLSLLASDEAPVDLIVFPETTYPFVVNDDNMPLAKMLGKPIVVGATTYQDSKVYNSLITSDENGKIQHVYSKSHLVPFGEYSPLGIMPSPANLARGAGAQSVSMDINGNEFVFAPAVCYEIIFSDSLIARGGNPTAIVNITNDTWFGKTPGTYQHLDMVRRYAIESGLPVIRANYSGISAFVLSDGRIEDALDIGLPGFQDGVVWGAHKTIYRAIGRNLMMIIILLISCICTFVLNRKK